MRPHYLIITSILLLTGTVLSAERINITVHGTVTDNEGKPVSEVQITDGTNITVTDRKGRYILESNSEAGFVYYTLPSGYEHSSYDGNIPVFYKEIDRDSSRQKIDFRLEKSLQDQTRHVCIVWADPQVFREEEFSELDKVVSDLDSTASSYDVPVIAISAGDNVFDKAGLIGKYKDCISRLQIPFYHVIGNHDMDYNERSDEGSGLTYESHFGPVHYSFNVGQLHYVVLKDVFYYGETYQYIGYITEQQLKWLQDDLSHVRKGSTVILAMHIPTCYGDTPEASGVTLMRNSVMNRQALYDILDGYNVHIMAGHSHIQWNTVISDTIFEHTHGAASGAWWQGPVCLDGTPKGYTVYEVDGDNVKWYFKGAGLDREDQFRVYTYGDSCIVNVYNYDPEWTVELFEDGVSKGRLEPYWGADPYSEGLYPPGRNKLHPWLSYGLTSHLFKARISDPEADITVKVTDRFGNIYEKTVPGWEPVWNDEFGYEGFPDPGKWTSDTLGNSYGWGNNEAQFYTFEDTDNATVSDGTLKITARREKVGGKEYTSARLVTKGKGDWKYARVTVRAKLPGGTGTWPAIWMLPTDSPYGGWPETGEIDIMEQVGYNPSEVFSTAHTGKYNHVRGNQWSGTLDLPDCTDTFHDYTLEWDEYSWRTYIDGQPVYAFWNEQEGYLSWPFDQKFHLILNLAIGGNLGGKHGIDNSSFPHTMEVDYVRVWQRR